MHRAVKSRQGLSFAAERALLSDCKRSTPEVADGEDCFGCDLRWAWAAVVMRRSVMRRMRMDSFYCGVNLVKHEDYYSSEYGRPSGFFVFNRSPSTALGDRQSYVKRKASAPLGRTHVTAERWFDRLTNLRGQVASETSGPRAQPRGGSDHQPSKGKKKRSQGPSSSNSMLLLQF